MQDKGTTYDLMFARGRDDGSFWVHYVDDSNALHADIEYGHIETYLKAQKFDVKELFSYDISGNHFVFNARRVLGIAHEEGCHTGLVMHGRRWVSFHRDDIPEVARRLDKCRAYIKQKEG